MTTTEHEVGEEIARYLMDTSSSDDPYPMYHRLRETDPVHWCSLGFWVVTSYAEAEVCFREPTLSRQLAGERQFGWLVADGDPPEARRALDAWVSSILTRDPPDHTRLRKLISRAFTPRAVTAWRARTTEIMEEIMAGLRGRDGFDVVSELGYPLPERVICEVIGVPPEDHDTWKQWNGTMGQSMLMAGRNKPGAELPIEVREPALRSLRAWYDYFGALVDRRRGDHGDDLLTLLVEAEEDGDRLSRDELIGTLTVLVQAGHETTSNLVTNALLAFMRNPDQYAALRDDPDLAAAAVEEVLRFDGPARGQPRVATVPIEVGGKQIRPGDLVMVIVNAANRDPARYPDPDRFDIGRDTSGHLAFASGIHYCVGAALARMEAEVALRAIALEPDVFALATDQLRYKASHGRNLVALPVERRPAGSLG